SSHGTSLPSCQINLLVFRGIRRSPGDPAARRSAGSRRSRRFLALLLEPAHAAAKLPPDLLDGVIQILFEQALVVCHAGLVFLDPLVRELAILHLLEDG